MRIMRMLAAGFILALSACASEPPAADISGQWQFGWYIPDFPAANQRLQHPVTGRPFKKSVCFLKQSGGDVTGTCDGCWVGPATISGTVNGTKFRLNAYLPGGDEWLLGSADPDGTLKGSLPDGILYFTARKVPGDPAALAQHACSWDFEGENPP